jgi:signal transduction histidine kinase
MSRPAAPAQPLLHTIGVRLAMVAVGLIGILTLVTVVEYTSDVGKLRRATLVKQAEKMFDWLRSGHPADFLEYCKRYPEAYGYRVFDDKNEILTQLNGGLFSEMPSYHNIGPPYLAFRHKPSGDPAKDQWLITRGEDPTRGGVWMQATVVGDPAALWREVIVEEIVDHVVIPTIVIIPPLSFAIFLALRSALRPLSRIAERARELAIEADSGAPLQELRMEELPREALDLVAAINVLLQKLESMLEQQKQFTDNAAHELRTPLAALLLQISCLSPSKPIERLKSDVAVLCRLVDQLLRLAQAEQLAKAGFRLHDLREIARAACEEMAVLATAQSRLLELDEPPTPVLTPCNAEFIQIAIRNVIENALRATPVGSTVAIVVNELAEIEVSDCGPGIPDAEKPLVFQRYWTQRRRNGEGAGIGLALVQRIVDLHGGATRVEDRPGGGACVTLSFRLHRPLESTPRACGGNEPVIEDPTLVACHAAPAGKSESLSDFIA